ncbi:FAD-dependent oxidoreductase [Pseudonocardia xishanensis]|uniref:ferredoxin--NADP(+) reductase n=1 Tax=Pseudonocardia xishanensis TaxID=630995 RepID=A0ABP8RK92_9PSEU
MISVAVVGAGPSGVFAAAELLKTPEASVDVLDRLPTPFGLVRYGVAPDHTRIKSVAKTMTRVLGDPRVRFLGNVEVGDVRQGATVDVPGLLDVYDAVLLATGAPNSRRLGIPGESLVGNHAAGDIVSWYNGHPGSGEPLATGSDVVTVIGAGNVSLDVARILLKGGAGLADTDVSQAVLGALDADPVREVHIVVRKGVTGTRFSVPELLEIERLAGVDIVVDEVDLALDVGERARYDSDRVVAQQVEVFRRWAERPPTDGGRRLRFWFGSRPVAIRGDGRVEEVVLEKAGVGTVELPTRAVIRSIGYLGQPVDGVPFDPGSGTIPNDRGRVGPGLYVTGWAKRGPNGIIGTNKACAVETVRRLVADLAEAPSRSTRPGAPSLPGSTVVTWEGWQRIDAAEIALGTSEGRARSKITELVRLLGIAATH